MFLDGKLGEDINPYQSSVLFAVDRFCTMKDLEKKFYPDTVVVFDRYVSSNILHQGGKIKDPKQLEKYLLWLEDFEFNLMKIPKPDKIFFLCVAPEQTKAITKKELNEEGWKKLQDAFDTGMKISKMFGWEIIYCIDEAKGQFKTREAISKEIQAKINAILGI